VWRGILSFYNGIHKFHEIFLRKGKQFLIASLDPARGGDVELLTIPENSK
jgi:hypothetical protein